MRPNGLFTLARTTGVATVLVASLAAGCGGGGGSDPQYAARPLRVVDMDLEGLDSVALNTPLTLEFSEFVAPQSIRPDTVQIRLGPRYGIQSFGDFKVAGNIVTFYPRLPTAADLSDAGFRPRTAAITGDYRVTVVGYPKVDHVSSYTGRALQQSFVGSFSTASSTDPDVFSTNNYKDPPPPAVRFTNPPDVIPQSPWTVLGGAKEVQTDATISIIFYRTPLLPSTVTASNVTLTMIERYGVAVVPPRPIQGTPTLDQSFDSVSMRFVPTFPLADQARYTLRIENRVTDLTGNWDLADNAARTALRTLSDGGTDPALTAFALAHPEEVDPRTFLIFTTRDEVTKDAAYTLTFDGTDRDQDGTNGLDSKNTTASFNTAVLGAVAGVLTAAGGTGVLGDFSPVSNTTLNTNTTDPLVTNGVFNFKKFNINSNITVTVVGTLPITINALRDVTITGLLAGTGGAGGAAEQNYQTVSMPLATAGTGVAGGGNGGTNVTTQALNTRGASGSAGANGGGGGGQGGYTPNSGGPYAFGGGGGGGGHQYAGTGGGPGTYPSYSSWNGTGGAGGAAGGIKPTSLDTDSGKLWYQKGVGGGGGGGGGNSYYSYPWYQGAASGGGGGGGILVKSAGNITVAGTATTGRITSLGGKGGNTGSTAGGGYYYYGAAGGGGGGGAIALYANDTLDVRNSTLDTSGGAGGSPYNYGWGGAGGKGGGGFVQLEALNTTSKILGYSSSAISGATILPDFYVGAFNPTGSASDAPSVFQSNWFNLGVFDPVLQAATTADFTDQNYAGCTIKYEIQMSREDPTNFGKADVSSISAATGNSSDAVKASNWVLLNDSTLGIQDVTGTADFTGMNGHHYQFYRLRISFTLKDGQTRNDLVPYVEKFRVRVKY